MAEPAKQIVLPATVAIFLIAIFLTLKTFIPGKSLSILTPQQQLDNGPVALEIRLNQNQNLEIWLVPNRNDLQINIITIDLTITPSSGQVFSTSSQPFIGKQFSETSWKFPFSNIKTNSDKSLTYSTSAVLSLTTPYSLDQSQLFATLPISFTETTSNINLQLNPTNSKIHVSQNTSYPLSLKNSAIIRE